MAVRSSKALLVLLAGVFALLVGTDNILDYQTNFRFVAHVLSMDTTFPDNRLLWRALVSEPWHHAAYLAIIAAELVVGLLCLSGAFRLFQALRLPAKDFNGAKDLAAAGLVLGFVLWFTGFLTIGGEWFKMWQSSTWNGQEAAFRLAVLFLLILIFLAQQDGEAKGAA